MAVNGEELELLSDEGFDADLLPNGRVYQNMVWRQSAWWNRLGFGQLAQFDSTFALPKTGTGEYGYQKALGSHAMVTDFGHVQIVTLLRGVMYTSNESASGEWRDMFSLSIYDATTDRRWEVGLHRHTSQSLGGSWDMPRWRGVYESARGLPLASWVSSQLDVPVWFNEFEGNLFFGAEGIGVQVYRPATFFETRRQQLDGVRRNDWSKGYSESSLVSPLPPADGLFADGFDYLGVDTFPSAVDMASFGERTVYVSGREVFFSDKLRPQSIMGRNVDFVPLREEIVAVESLHGMVYVFGKTEVVAIQPDTSGAVAAGGRQVQLATHVGALSPSSVIKADGKLFWFDEQGAYVTTGNLTFQKISDSIDPLFESVISNPLTNYYANSGWSSLTLAQPRLSYSIKESAGAHMAYDPVEELLFLVLPEQNCSWVFQQGRWTLWNFESVSNNTVSPAVVEAQRNIVAPWVVTADRGVYVVGGVERYAVVDTTIIGGDGASLDLDASSGSYYILQLGRGGGLDRSVSETEDRRQMNGRYLVFNEQPDTRGAFYINEPIKMPDQYVMPNNPVKQDNVWMFPVSVVHQADGIVEAQLHVGYDNNQWEPVYRDNAAAIQIDLVYPPEREGSKAGWGDVTPTVTHQARTFDGAAYARGGKEIHFNFDGPDGVTDLGGPGSAWTTQPNINAPQWSEVPLFWLPMKKKTPGNNVMGMGWKHISATLMEEGEAALDQSLFAWQLSDANGKYTNDEVAQPVDWVFKSAQVEFDGRQHKARGLSIRAMSHGSSDAPLFPNWMHGLLNIVLATDYRGWVSQIVDYTGDIEGVRRIADRTSIRSRLKNTTNVMTQRVFGTDAKWGVKSDSTKGNVLIGDEEWNEIAVSDRGRGSTSTWMLFGHIRSRAERISLSSVKGIYRLLGGRRRGGR